MGNEQSTMQASEVIAADSDQRRAYLLTFVHIMGGNYVEKVMIEYLFAEERVCDRLNELGIVQVGTVHFEYQVDRATWINLCKSKPTDTYVHADIKVRRLRDQAPLLPFEEGLQWGRPSPPRARTADGHSEPNDSRIEQPRVYWTSRQRLGQNIFHEIKENARKPLSLHPKESIDCPRSKIGQKSMQRTHSEPVFGTTAKAATKVSSHPIRPPHNRYERGLMRNESVVNGTNHMPTRSKLASHHELWILILLSLTRLQTIDSLQNPRKRLHSTISARRGKRKTTSDNNKIYKDRQGYRRLQTRLSTRSYPTGPSPTTTVSRSRQSSRPARSSSLSRRSWTSTSFLWSSLQTEIPTSAPSSRRLLGVVQSSGTQERDVLDYTLHHPSSKL